MTGVTDASIDPAAHKALTRMAHDLRRVFDTRFVALVTSEHQTTAAFVTSISAADLDAVGSLVETWSRERLATPLLVTVDEFRRSLDTFPAEYQSLLDHHVVIDGAPPFDGVRINADDLRRACEAQARGHLIHLRQGWIDAHGSERHLEALLVRSAAPLRLVLSNLAQLQGEDHRDDAALAAFAGRAAGMTVDLVRAVLALDTAATGSRSLVPRLPEYLADAERLWMFVDGWRAR
jgi:hypothetical protein